MIFVKLANLILKNNNMKKYGESIRKIRNFKMKNIREYAIFLKHILKIDNLTVVQTND